MLAHQHGIDMDAAHTLLQQTARDNQDLLTATAANIVRQAGNR